MMKKKINKLDIFLHTAPTVAVGIAMGFACAFGLHSLESGLGIDLLFIPGSAIGAWTFTVLWNRREKKQKGREGQFGGIQSKLEGWIPFWLGTASYLASTTYFYFWPL